MNQGEVLEKNQFFFLRTSPQFIQCYETLEKYFPSRFCSNWKMFAQPRKLSNYFLEFLFAICHKIFGQVPHRRCCRCQGSLPTGGGRPGPPSQPPLIHVPNHMWIVFIFMSDISSYQIYWIFIIFKSLQFLPTHSCAHLVSSSHFIMQISI